MRLISPKIFQKKRGLVSPLHNRACAEVIDLNAVWFWKKLALRGSSRSGDGSEALAYYEGGFAALAERMREEIIRHGGEIRLNDPVTALRTSEGLVTHVVSSSGETEVGSVLATPAFPIIADLLEQHVEESYIASLRRVNYLANKCLVLELDRSLSDTYWIDHPLSCNHPTVSCRYFSLGIQISAGTT